MEKFSEEQCFQIIQKKYGNDDFKITKIEEVPYQNLSGFLGQYRSLQIDVESKNEKKTHKFFVKNIPLGFGASIIRDEGFPKESFIYITYQETLHQINVTCLDDLIAKCYLVEDGEFMVLDDLAQLGFKTYNIRTPYSIEMLRIATKALSRFHASSLLSEEILTEKQGKKFRWNKEYPNIFSEFNPEKFKTGSPVIVGWNTVKNIMIDMFPEVCKDMSIDEFKRRCDAVFEKNFELMFATEKFRSTLVHGDMWGANVLFSKDSDGNYKDCKFVDFQFLNYHIPVQDLLLFLYISTDRETRLKYMDELINLHYNEIKTIFESYGRNLDLVYTYEQFMESYKYINPRSICQAIIYAQTNLVPSDKMKELQKTDMIFSKDRTAFIKEVVKDELHKARLKESLEDFYNVCLEINI